MKYSSLLTSGVAIFALSGAALADAPSAASVAARAFITPESLAIAGFDVEDAETMLSRLDAISPFREGFGEAADGTDQAGRDATLFAACLRRGACDTENVEGYADAAQDFAAGAASLESSLDFFFSVAMAEFPQGAAETAAHVGANLHRRAPREFLVLEKTEDEWQAIERAIVAERRADRLNEELAEEHADLLEDIRGEAAVIEAAARLG